MRSKGLVLAAAIVVLVIAIVEIFGASEPFLQRLGADVLAATSTFLVVRYLSSPPDRVPLLEYNVLMMTVFWGVPAAGFAGSRAMLLPEDAKVTAVWLCVLAQVAISAGFLASRVIQPQKHKIDAHTISDSLPQLPLPWLAIWLGWIAFVATGRTLALPGSIRHVGFLLGNSLPLLTFLSIHSVKSGTRWVLWSVTILLSAAGAISGFFSAIVGPIAATVFLLWFLEKRFHYGVVVSMIGLFLLLQPAKGIYRSRVWDRSDRLAKQDTLTGLKYWQDSLDQAWFKESRRGELLSGSFDRLDELTPVSVAVAYCPNIIPHAEGRPWLDVVTLLIPRALWPNKPTQVSSTNNRFQITFGLQTREASEVWTGAFPVPADGWWNFGLIGIAIPGLVIGLLFGALCRLIGTHTWARLTLSTTLMMGCPLTQDIAGTMTNWIKLISVTAAVCWFLKEVTKRTSNPRLAARWTPK